MEEAVFVPVSPSKEVPTALRFNYDTTGTVRVCKKMEAEQEGFLGKQNSLVPLLL